MELDQIFGLPAHPLVVHAAVVLLPLAAVGVVVMAAVPRARRHYAPVVFGLALVATIAVGLAQGSGEALEERVDETHLVEEHTEQGERVLPWAIGVTVAAAAVAAADPVRKRFELERPGANAVTAGLLALGLVTGIGATWTVVEVGHSGATAAWDDVSDAAGNGGNEADEADEVDDHDDDDEDHEGSAPLVSPEATTARH